MTDPDVLVAGETLIDFLPAVAEAGGLAAEETGQSRDETGPSAEPDRTGAPTGLAGVERFVRRPGGAPANVAVALARLGPAPWFWTRVGADPFGDFLAVTLEMQGLPDRFVERDPEAATTLAFVSGGDDPAFTFYRDGTADTRLEPGTVPDDVLATVDWCYAGGVALAEEPARTAIIDLVDRAAEHDVTVAFDPNARPELWAADDAGSGGGNATDGDGNVDADDRNADGPDGADVIDGGRGSAGEDEFAEVVGGLLGLVDLVAATPSDLRAAGVSVDDDRPDALARAVCDRGPHTALVTLGADGAVGHATDRAPWGPATVRHDGYAVEAVDPTGAGDAFAAGAIRSLADGASLVEAVEFANAVAACATTGRGAMAALPDRAAVDALRGE